MIADRRRQTEVADAAYRQRLEETRRREKFCCDREERVRENIEEHTRSALSEV